MCSMCMYVHAAIVYSIIIILFEHMLSVCRLIEVGKLESAQTSGYYPAGQVLVCVCAVCILLCVSVYVCCVYLVVCECGMCCVLCCV